jgi:TPR repeat protein
MANMPTCITSQFDAILDRRGAAEAFDFLAPFLAEGSAEAIFLSSSINSGGDEASFEKMSLLAIQESAGMGYVPAVYTMGLRYLFGDSVERDVEAAAACFSSASAAGYPAAMYEYGLALFHGVGVHQDVPAALSLIRRAATEGDEYALEFLSSHGDDES